jgi:hypothetical protein
MLSVDLAAEQGAATGPHYRPNGTVAPLIEASTY